MLEIITRHGERVSIDRKNAHNIEAQLDNIHNIFWKQIEGAVREGKKLRIKFEEIKK